MQTETAESLQTKIKKLLPALSWASLFLAVVAFFTLLKLPEQQIGQLLIEKINETLQQSTLALEISAERTRLSLLPLPAVRLEEVTLKARDATGNPIRANWKSLRIRPSVLDLILGRLGATIEIQAGLKPSRLLSASAWSKGSSFSLDLTLNQAELGETGLSILPLFAHISGKIPVSGRVQLSGNSSDLTALSGMIQLSFETVELPAQKISSFSTPKLTIRGGEIRAGIAASKLKIDSFRLGKPAEAGDDLAGTLSGSITLGKTLDSSQMDLKAMLRVSEAVNRAFFIIDAILGVGRKPDGSYSLSLNGPLYAPILGPGGS
ncbi:MAG: type II secretion system protein GspN [Oligoflexia bacterium]